MMLKTCPACKEQNPPELRHCKKCGASLAVKKTRNLLFCKKCGHDNREDIKFCVKCGNTLENSIVSKNFDEEINCRIVHLPGEEIIENRYSVIDILGGGGFGTVYKVKDKKIDRYHAIKEFDTVTVNREKQIANFIKEAQVLTDIRHTSIPYSYYREVEEIFHVCPLCTWDPPPKIDYLKNNFYNYGSFLRDHRPCPQHKKERVKISRRYYLIMDFIEGETLENLARKNNLPGEKEIVKWILEIAEALKALHEHEKKIIHRDIKPDNIIIKKDDNRAYLIDFGLAKADMELFDKTCGNDKNVGTRKWSQVAGTRGYMPPEVIKGFEKASEAGDIFALGMTLYRLISGSDPQDREGIKGDEMRAKKPEEFNPRISKTISKVIMKSTSYDPSRRYRNINDFIKDLSRLMPFQAQVLNIQPLIICDEKAFNLEDLADLMDTYPEKSLEYMELDSFSPLLKLWGELEMAKTATEMSGRGKTCEDLEYFIRKIYSSLKKDGTPLISLEEDNMDFPDLYYGEEKDFFVKIKKTGRGYLTGQVSYSGNNIITGPPAFHDEGHNFRDDLTLTVPLKIKTINLKAGDYREEISVKYYGLCSKLTVSFTVKSPEISGEPDKIEIKGIDLGSLRKIKITLSNKKKRGIFDAKLTSKMAEITHPETVYLNPADREEIEILINTKGLSAGKSYKDEIIFETVSGDIFKLPVLFRVSFPWTAFSVFGTLSLLSGGILFSGIRYLFGLISEKHIFLSNMGEEPELFRTGTAVFIMILIFFITGIVRLFK